MLGVKKEKDEIYNINILYIIRLSQSAFNNIF